MTKDEALKLALEALTNAYWPTESDLMPAHNIKECAEAITAIKEALAQPEHGWTSERIAGMSRLKEAQDKKLAQPEQEPVGQLLENAFGRGQVMWFNKPKDESMLYTTPPQRKPLTDEEIYDVYNEPRSDAEMIAFARAIEAKLKEKNA